MFDRIAVVRTIPAHPAEIVAMLHDPRVQAAIDTANTVTHDPPPSNP